MTSGYIPIAVLILVAAIIGGAMIGLSFLFGPRKPTAFKSSSYECGITPVGNARERFPIKFYLVAMLFIIFDIETIFLWPWVVSYGNQEYGMKQFFLVEMVTFVVILFIGYFYILGKGALDWDESDRTTGHDVVTAETKAKRAPIRFGNEASGVVDIEKQPIGERSPSYGASSQEEIVAGGKR